MSEVDASSVLTGENQASSFLPQLVSRNLKDGILAGRNGAKSIHHRWLLRETELMKQPMEGIVLPPPPAPLPQPPSTAPYVPRDRRELQPDKTHSIQALNHLQHRPKKKNENSASTFDREDEILMNVGAVEPWEEDGRDAFHEYVRRATTDEDHFTPFRKEALTANRTDMAPSRTFLPPKPPPQEPIIRVTTAAECYGIDEEPSPTLYSFPMPLPKVNDNGSDGGSVARGLIASESSTPENMPSIDSIESFHPDRASHHDDAAEKSDDAVSVISSRSSTTATISTQMNPRAIMATRLRQASERQGQEMVDEWRMQRVIARLTIRELRKIFPPVAGGFTASSNQCMPKLVTKRVDSRLAKQAQHLPPISEERTKSPTARETEGSKAEVNPSVRLPHVAKERPTVRVKRIRQPSPPPLLYSHVPRRVGQPQPRLEMPKIAKNPRPDITINMQTNGSLPILQSVERPVPMTEAAKESEEARKKCQPVDCKELASELWKLWSQKKVVPAFALDI